MTPGVNLRLEYDDNIYLDSNNEKDDVITTVTPSIDMQWETSRLDLSLFASVSMEKYMDNTDKDRIGAGESGQTSRLNALAKIYREVLFLRVSDTYARVAQDEGGRGGENNRTVNLTDSNTLQINPYLQFELAKDTQLQMGYTYKNLWYKEKGSDDSESHLFSASLTKELSARTSMSLSGSYQEYRPKNPDDVRIIGNGGTYEYDKTNVSVGLSYQVTERLQLQGS
ncbi:MAG: TIGR03016 family PEP-CTERM system-associated outer membrane protein, partial [Candidatus Marinimicrobia bacterium]|nr:TIGR03016 family PEP-CTERM system-associated outer membrane protein [Candidatus Neomarinimicrobiota bacterium]